MNFVVAIIALLGTTTINPRPNIAYQNLDMCETAKRGAVDDLQHFGAVVLTARCNLLGIQK